MCFNDPEGTLSKDSMNFDSFLWRMARYNHDYPSTIWGVTDEYWLRLIDPQDDVQPWELFDSP